MYRVKGASVDEISLVKGDIEIRAKTAILHISPSAFSRHISVAVKFPLQRITKPNPDKQIRKGEILKAKPKVVTTSALYERRQSSLKFRFSDDKSPEQSVRTNTLRVNF